MKTRQLLSRAISTAAVTSMAFLPLTSAADDTIGFAGIDVKEDSAYVYAGAIHAFRGLGVDGPALKVFVGGGEFDYDTDASGAYPGGNVDADSRAADLMIGYRKHTGNLQLGIYAGVNYQDVDQDLIKAGGTKTDADVDGSETGFKVGFEVNRSAAQGPYVDVRGNYSTAYDTYWTRGRVGWKVGSVTIGPEVAFMGNDDFDQERAGVFFLFSNNVNAAIGYADTDGNGGDSAYGSLGVSTTF